MPKKFKKYIFISAILVISVVSVLNPESAEKVARAFLLLMELLK